ncbi:MAG: DUF4215 domain-containing protein [Deltaproteobacteria bacterium]|nr:DUF4215 domain-containing protein [Deltaproteobacteria bacterium]
MKTQSIALGLLFAIPSLIACGRFGYNEPQDEPACGNGVVEAGEICDDGNADPGDGCSDACRIEPGWACDGREPSSCIPYVVCGNGVVEPPEGCDDGDTDPGDGCSSYCQVEPGWTCDDEEPSGCTHTVGCGDGVREDPEVCDDGYQDACGTCNADCTGPGTGAACGDSEICPELEVCDDGYTDACGTCNADCSGPGAGAACGDSQICPELEACDDGVNDGGEGECLPGCGGFQICGDGDREGTEVCDDGTNDGGEGECVPGCTAVQVCGNSSREGTEACDDGVNDGGEGECAPGCTAVQICGNGTPEGTELCDDGENDGGERECLPGCARVQICGDGTPEGTESCDEGNVDPCGDCNADCTGAGSGAICSVSSIRSGAWSEPGVWTWNRIPHPTDEVVISPNSEVVFSGASIGAACQDIDIQPTGTLRLEGPADVHMLVEGDIQVDGTLSISDSPGHGAALEIVNSSTCEHGVVVGDGGTLSANCSPPAVLTSLASGYAAGSRTVTAVDVSGLAPGERIAIGADESTEAFFIERIDGQQIVLDCYADRDQPAGAPVYKLYTVLTAACSSDVLAVASAQGIEPGDVLAVGSTSTSQTQTELDFEVIDVVGDSITLDRSLAVSHNEGAEVVKINRACLIGAADPAYTTYVLVEDGGNLDLDYVELRYLGHDVVGQEGLTINTSAPSTPLNGCSVHDGLRPVIAWQGSHMTLTSNVVCAFADSGIRFMDDASSDNNVYANVVFRQVGSGSAYAVWAQDGDRIDMSYNTVFSSNRGLQAFPGCTGCTVHANVAHSNSVGLHFCSSIFDSFITSNRTYWSSYGIYLHNPMSNNLVANNISFANSYGIYINTGTDGANYVLNNTFDGNSYGLNATDGTTGTIVRNNIFSNSITGGIQAQGTGAVINTYNDVWSPTGAGYLGNVAAGTGDFSADPLFVPEGALGGALPGYLLQSTVGFYPFDPGDVTSLDSPCLDAGDPDDAFDLEPVTNGGRINLGAHGDTPYASKSLP